MTMGYNGLRRGGGVFGVDDSVYEGKQETHTMKRIHRFDCEGCEKNSCVLQRNRRWVVLLSSIDALSGFELLVCFSAFQTRTIY